MSLGLSLDAVIYSLGYLGDEVTAEILNATRAKAQFLASYERYGYSSLADYYKAVAVDLLATNTLDELEQVKGNSSFLCRGCIGTALASKWYFDGQICYRFDLSPQDGESHKSSARRQRLILMKVADLSGGFYQAIADWSLFAIGEPANLDLGYHPGSSLVLVPFTRYVVRLSAQRLITSKHVNTPCAHEETYGANYSSETCYARCVTDEDYPPEHCDLFYESVGRGSPSPLDHPTKFCNAYDIPGASYWERLEFMDSHLKDDDASGPAAGCTKRCPQKCDRMMYELSLRSQIDEAHTVQAFQNAMKDVRKMNMSGLEITVEHGAVYQGGIMTITEIDAYSFATFISNLGGALGLFVGATMMTFVQMIMFGAKLVLDKIVK